jgi:Uncharacterized protein conserved in bacteria (DUF2213)
MPVFRCDRGLVVKPEKTEEGFLRCMFRFRKVGELPYVNADGSRHIEVVTRENLLNTDSLKTARQKPITQLHPPGKVVTPQNSHLYVRGMSGEAMLTDGDYTMISGTITHSDLIDKILSGDFSDVSSGYWSDKVPRNDGKFDQVNAYYNHFAGVPYGRAGPDVNWFSADEADPLPEGFAVQDIDTADLRLDKPILFVPNVLPKAKHSMITTLKLDDSTTLSIGDTPGEQELAKHLSSLLKIKTDAAELDTQLQAERTKAIALETERDVLAEKATAAETEVATLKAATTDSAEIQKAYESGKARAALETRIAEITGAEVKTDASDRDLKISAITKVRGTTPERYAAMPDLSIDALYDDLPEKVAKINVDAAGVQMRSLVTPPNNDMAMAGCSGERVAAQKKPLKYGKK